MEQSLPVILGSSSLVDDESNSTSAHDALEISEDNDNTDLQMEVESVCDDPPVENVKKEISGDNAFINTGVEVNLLDFITEAPESSTTTSQTIQVTLPSTTATFILPSPVISTSQKKVVTNSTITSSTPICVSKPITKPTSVLKPEEKLPGIQVVKSTPVEVKVGASANKKTALTQQSLPPGYKIMPGNTVVYPQTIAIPIATAHSLTAKPSIMLPTQQVSFLHPGMRHASVQVHEINNVQRMHSRVEGMQEELDKLIQADALISKKISKLKSVTAEFDKKIHEINTKLSPKELKFKLTNDAKSYMSEIPAALFEWQMRMGKKATNARRWTRDDIRIASELFTQSQDAYTYLIGKMALPSMRMLFTHDMDLSDEEMLFMPTAKRKTTDNLTNEERETLRKEAQVLSALDVESLIENVENAEEPDDDDVADNEPQPDIEDLWNERRTTSEIVLNSKNTYVIDLTKLTPQVREPGKSSDTPHKVVVYIPAPGKFGPRKKRKIN